MKWNCLTGIFSAGSVRIFWATRRQWTTRMTSRIFWNITWQCDVACHGKFISLIPIWVFFQRTLEWYQMNMGNNFTRTLVLWRSGTKVSGMTVYWPTTANSVFLSILLLYDQIPCVFTLSKTIMSISKLDSFVLHKIVFIYL